ncbi:MAG TPA: alpha/beta fold hydrolase [Actinomycetota bacterium]|nr:alpha/beta fold hydrolase [Actinomycetota bacterium]
MAARRWRRRLLVTVAGLVAAGSALWSIPATRSRLKALGLVAEIAGVPFPRPWAPAVDVEEAEIAPGVVGDMYGTDEDAPPILFVPGATRRGREDDRVVGAARALAHAGRRVFVPELDLYDRVFRRSDIDRLVASLAALGRDRRVGVLGFSYGGSFAFVAAAHPSVADDVAFVATFGSYFDLANVIQGITTGSTTLDGETIAFATVPEAHDILIDAAVGMAPRGDAGELAGALRSHDPSHLPPGTRAFYDLLVNTDPGRSAELVADLPQEIQETLHSFSPASYASELAAPLFVMQARNDPATPWTEAVLIERSVPRSRLVMVDRFSHVDAPGLGGWLDDGPGAWSFASWILEVQE